MNKIWYYKWIKIKIEAILMNKKYIIKMGFSIKIKVIIILINLKEEYHLLLNNDFS